MDGGQICFLEKMQVGEKHWPAFKNCFKAALWKFNHIGGNFFKNNKITPVNRWNSNWITYRYYSKLSKGHLKAMLVEMAKNCAAHGQCMIKGLSFMRERFLIWIKEYCLLGEWYCIW